MDIKTVYPFNTSLGIVYGNLILRMLLPSLHCTLVNEFGVLQINKTSILVVVYTWNLILSNVEEFFISVYFLPIMS
jgi:hypothetical protein